MIRSLSVWFTAALLAVLPFASEAQSPSASSATVLSGNKVATVPFRSGTIYSAEITKVKPQFDVESPFDTPAVENPAWVELIVKLENGRSISRFDYEIEGITGKYACFAVAEGADGYSVDAEKWTVKKPVPQKYYRLLFPVKQEEFGGAVKGLITVTLKVRLFESKLPGTEIKLRVMPDGVPFSRLSSLPANGAGNCNIPYDEAFGPAPGAGSGS